MSDIETIDVEAGVIKGFWNTNVLKVTFIGKLLDKNTQAELLNIDFSFPFSFIKKYGKQTVIDEISSSVNEYMKEQLKI